MKSMQVNKLNRRYLISVLVLVLLLYAVVPQVGDFRSSWRYLSQPDIGWTVMAIGLTLATYLFGAATYCWLAFKRLNYFVTVLVQLAAMFINRLLPAGIGALGTNYAYLRQVRHSKTQAVVVVGVNNFVGWLGHSVILIVSLLAFGSNNLGFNVQQKLITSAGKLIIMGLIIGLILVVVATRRRLRASLASLVRQLVSYRQRPLNLVGALITSMGLTLCNVLALLACARALGIELSFLPVLLIFSFGVGLGSATPTPGGLGGYEAGLTAGFVAYKIDSPVALATALLYRLVSYWLPLILGAAAFAISQQRKLLSAAKNT